MNAIMILIMTSYEPALRDEGVPGQQIDDVVKSRTQTKLLSLFIKRTWKLWRFVFQVFQPFLEPLKI